MTLSMITMTMMMSIRYCMLSYVLCIKRVSARLRRRFPSMQEVGSNVNNYGNDDDVDNGDVDDNDNCDNCDDALGGAMMD